MGEVLSLLIAEPARAILTALQRRPLRPTQLEQTHLIPHTTLHRYLSDLEEHRAVERREIAGPPHAVQYALTTGGRELRDVVRQVEDWLRARPDFPLDPTSAPAWKAVNMLRQAWTERIMQRLVMGVVPANHLIGSPPSVTQGRLAGLRDAGILAKERADSGTIRLALSAWGRRGVGVIAAAARWEDRHAGNRARLSAREAVLESIQIALPLVRPTDIRGLCEFTLTDRSAQAKEAFLRVWAEVGPGSSLRSGSGLPPGPADAWIQGEQAEWLDALIDGRVGRLQVGGDAALGRHLVVELHDQLNGGGS